MPAFLLPWCAGYRAEVSPDGRTETGYIVATSFGYDCVFLPLSNRKLLMLLAIRAAIEPPTHGLLIRWQTLILISPYY